MFTQCGTNQAISSFLFFYSPEHYNSSTTSTHTHTHSSMSVISPVCVAGW